MGSPPGPLAAAACSQGGATPVARRAHGAVSAAAAAAAAAAAVGSCAPAPSRIPLGQHASTAVTHTPPSPQPHPSTTASTLYSEYHARSMKPLPCSAAAMHGGWCARRRVLRHLAPAVGCMGHSAALGAVPPPPAHHTNRARLAGCRGVAHLWQRRDGLVQAPNQARLNPGTREEHCAQPDVAERGGMQLRGACEAGPKQPLQRAARGAGCL